MARRGSDNLPEGKWFHPWLGTSFTQEQYLVTTSLRAKYVKQAFGDGKMSVRKKKQLWNFNGSGRIDPYGNSSQIVSNLECDADALKKISSCICMQGLNPKIDQ